MRTRRFPEVTFSPRACLAGLFGQPAHVSSVLEPIREPLALHAKPV